MRLTISKEKLSIPTDELLSCLAKSCNIHFFFAKWGTSSVFGQTFIQPRLAVLCLVVM